MAKNRSSDQSDTNNHQSSEQTSYNGKVDEKSLKTWNIKHLPNITGRRETKIYDEIIDTFTYLKNNQGFIDKEMSSFKVKLKFLLCEYPEEIENCNKIDFEKSAEDIKKLFNLHNRSINFVRTFIENVEETWEELKKDLINYKPKKKNETIEEVIKAVGEFIPFGSPIIKFIWELIGRINEYSDKKQLSNQIQLLFRNWTNALVKCAVDILYSYEEYLFKAKTMGDVKKIAENAAHRVKKYDPGNDKDLDTDKCYKGFLKSLILAPGNGETATFVFNEPTQELLEKELKIDDIFEKAQMFIFENGYRRVENSSWSWFWSWPWSWPWSWFWIRAGLSNCCQYGCRKMFKCPGIEILCDKGSITSDNDIRYCFDETLTCNYQWEFDLNDENSFLTLYEKYSLCAKNSSEILIAVLNHLQNLSEQNKEIKELIQIIADQMQQDKKEIKDTIKEGVKAVTEKGEII